MSARGASRILHAVAPLGVLAFWGGLWLAARRYPSRYDWRYITISSLLYPDRDPHGYLWAWAGVVLCGLTGLYWTTTLIRRGRQQHDAPLVGVRILGFGYLCMVCCVLPAWVVRIPKGHELLSMTAFLCVCIGIVQLTFYVGERSARQLSVPQPRLRAGILAAIALSPVVLAGLTQAYIAYARPTLPWVGLAWRSLGVPLYLSFALWQWITCGVLSLYMAGLSRTTLAARWTPQT